MLKVGITGGIGSGKSTVCRFFEYLGVPVYYADAKARSLMATDESLKTSIRERFGEAAYDASGHPDRKYLAGKVFNDAEALEELNAMVHPSVRRDSADWMRLHADRSYIIYEAAILFETGGHEALDKVIAVYAPESIRIERVMRRDGADRTAVEQRIARQMDDGKKVDLADYVIYNDGSRSVVVQVLELHKELISLSGG